MGRNNLTGAWGEALAVEYLRKKKYKILACGYRTRFGEIDIIAEKRGFIVFAEVKTRKNSDFAQAKEFVDMGKRERLRTTADYYLSQNPADLQPRFDVIEVYAPFGTDTQNPQIIHTEDAFQ